VERTAEAIQPETTSLSPGVRFVYRTYNHTVDGATYNPNITLVSYASFANTANGSGLFCTGTMVGPNLMLTAGHCGFSGSLPGSSVTNGYPTRNIKWTLARNFDPTTYPATLPSAASQWDAACIPLEQSFGGVESTSRGSDLQLLYCPSVGGVGPGDVFGYVEPRAPSTTSDVTVNQALRGIFTSNAPNAATSFPFITPVIPSATLQYGSGWVTSVSATPAPPVRNNIPDEGGNSGSLTYDDQLTHILLGPLNGGTGTTRNVRSMYQYLTASRTYFDNSSFPDVNVSAINALTNTARTPPTNLGLNGFNYGGYSPTGGLLDVLQEGRLTLARDIENATGENYRPWMYLGFDSLHRSNLWTNFYSSAVSINVATGAANVNIYGAVRLLQHDKLNIPADGQSYRITVTVSASSQGNSSPLSIGFCNMVGGACQYTANTYLSTVVGQTRTFSVAGPTISGASKVILVIDSNTSFAGSIRDVNVIREDAVMNFDRADMRHWHNNITGERGQITPNGRVNSGTGIGGADPALPSNANNTISTPSGSQAVSPVDWALFVEQHPSAPSGDAQRNLQMGFVQGTNYCMCFYHTTDRYYGAVTGRVRVQSFNGSTWTNLIPSGSETFTPGVSWSRQCVTFTPTTGHNALLFGTTGTTGNYLNNYYVDDISIRTNVATCN